MPGLAKELDLRPVQLEIGVQKSGVTFVFGNAGILFIF
jgi:hypothetical protein